MSAKAQDFARRIGRLAFEAGRTLRANPYNHRAQCFRSAWRDGWLEASREAGQLKLDTAGGPAPRRMR